MSTWFSELRLRVAALASVGAVAAAALTFHILQNRFALTGGNIAWPKSLWLGCAILYWFVLPMLLVSDARLTASVRAPFVALLALMTSRGVVELWMLYVTHNWSPWYGIAHDLVCMAALWGLALRIGPCAGPQRTALKHAVFTGLLFIPEIYFAWYMQANFRTQGKNPLYFVPDVATYAHVLLLTKAAAAGALIYLPGFLYAWLYGKSEAADPPLRRTE